ncbi:MAG: BamA/TamA family outer membrane protein [Bacteroidota bacterium]|nr:BamA/TamA family outer membrane protein [Bacteroidota bacterium]
MKNLFAFIFCFFFSIVTFSQEKVEIVDISIKGNKITNDEIILRELTFKKGDLLNSELLEEKVKDSKENLTNLMLFNFTDISIEKNEEKVNILVEVVERWYIWPYPIVELSERNFNVWWDEFKESSYTDFSRINYGVYLVWENFRGKNELLKIKYRRGFKEHYLFSYDIPYFNKEKTIGLTVFAQQFRRKKSFYNTIGNQLVYYENADQYTTKDFEIEMDVFYRKDTRHKHKLKLNYLYSSISDSIAILNSDYLKNQQQDGSYFKATYQYENEQRDYIIYPLKGHYLHFELTKNFAGTSPVNHFEAMAKAEKHIELQNRLFIGSSFMVQVSTDKYQPYFAQKGLGFDNYVRAYEYYVVDGQSFWLSKTAIKYQIIGKTNFELPYVKMSQFKKSHYALYFSVFTDLGYVIDNQNAENNSLTNSLLIGRGISLDYVTYYDKLLRIEYGINRLGEKGLFLHFTNPF